MNGTNKNRVDRYRCCIAGDGKSAEVGDWLKVGKRRAGRLLDAKEWNEMPEGKCRKKKLFKRKF
mgnify:CR=1 FL=1